MSFLHRDPDWYIQYFGDQTPATDGSLVNSPFLTPPRSVRRDLPFPFKAPESDNTSMSLKKRHHAKHGWSKYGRECVSHSELGTLRDRGISSTPLKLIHSKSLPCLTSGNLPAFEGKLSTSTRAASRCASKYARHRRWTLPSKATSTRGLSTISPVFRHHGKTRRSKVKASPAIITLRRATNTLGQSNSLTFFPPPKFSRTRTSFLSYFLDTMTGESQQSDGVDKSGIPVTKQPRKLSSIQSVNGGKAQMAESDIASPTVTEVTVQPALSLPFPDLGPFPPRRCSTKFVTDSSVYEVIWDENDTPSDSSEASRRPTIVMDSTSRRQSVAAAQLETQLNKAVAHLRRASATWTDNEQREPSSSTTHRWSFQSMLNQSFSRLINEAALRNLPHSAAFRRSQMMKSIVSADTPIHQIVKDVDNTFWPGETEVFPPLPFIDSTIIPTWMRKSSFASIIDSKPVKNSRDYTRDHAEPNTDADGQSQPKSRIWDLVATEHFGATAARTPFDEDTIPLLSTPR